MVTQLDSALGMELDGVELKVGLLERLARSDADIVVVPRQVESSQLASMVMAAPLREERLEVVCNEARSIVGERLIEMGLGSDWLADDIASAVALFSKLFDQKQVELRLEVTDQQTCPKFHCDNVYMRMLITYFGPTTEYIERTNPDQIERASVGDLVFLKGHLNPSCRGRMLHRSPPVPAGEKRLTIIVNFSEWLGSAR